MSDINEQQSVDDLSDKNRTDAQFELALDEFHPEWRSLYAKRVIDIHRHFFNAGYKAKTLS